MFDLKTSLKKKLAFQIFQSNDNEEEYGTNDDEYCNIARTVELERILDEVKDKLDPKKTLELNLESKEDHESKLQKCRTEFDY